MQNARERTRTSAVNLFAFKVLARWDFSSYPESYPDAVSAGARRVGKEYAVIITPRTPSGRSRTSRDKFDSNAQRSSILTVPKKLTEPFESEASLPSASRGRLRRRQRNTAAAPKANSTALCVDH